METFHFLGAVDHALSRLSRSFMGLKLPLCKMKMESLHCQFESSYFLCENGIRKPKAENLLFSSQAEAFCGGGFEAVTVKPCSAMMAVKPFFFFFSVKLQLQAEERGVVSIKGVSANRFLAMKEDGRLLALVSSTFLMSLCCCVLPLLCVKQLFFLQDLLSCLVWGLSGEMSSVQLLSIT